MSDQNKSWRLTLTPVDSWYFRESRPHGAAGGDRLESLFPPPVKPWSEPFAPAWESA